jgi:hypothetical protein
MSKYKFPVILLVTGAIAILMSVTIAMAQDGVGSVSVRDSNPGNLNEFLSDQATVQFTNIPALPANKAYEGWFVSDNGSVSAGILVPDAKGNINQTASLMSGNAPSGENIFAQYHTFVISIEPVPDDGPGPAADKPYKHTIPKGAFDHIGQLLYSGASNPAYTTGFHAGKPKGITVGLREQISTALTDAGLSANSSTLAVVKANACHVVNIIEGTKGANFDATCGNPGDGFGVLSYAADTIKHADFASNATPGEASVVANRAKVVAATTSATEKASLARDLALRVKDQDQFDAAVVTIRSAQQILAAALDDATSAYSSAQDMGTYPLPLVAVTPKTGDPIIPNIAMASLLAGAFLLFSGVFVFWRTRPRRKTA